MKNGFETLVLIALSLSAQCTVNAEVSAPTPFGAVPSSQQLAWHEIEVFGMVNFSTITFYGKEWGYGDEEAARFNPSEFDALQIVRAAKAGGLKGLVIDAKHHGGFCLWPSAFNDTYTVKNTPWREGKGDMVREFADACRAEGLLVGVYLSPWDRNHKAYGQPEYVTYYHNQLRELLTNYGPLFEVWFDGANGGDGWYGGGREKRKIGPDYYQWEKVMAIVQECQPQAVCFGRRDVRWVGNERGIAPDPCWASVSRDGKSWYPAECDFPLRHGWFWHPGGHGRHSAAQLVDRYFSSVGRNAAMDLGIAPDRRGRIDEHDVDVLKGFGERIHAIFATNLARTATASASNVRGNAAAYSANNVLLGTSKFKKYWATDDHVKDADIVVDFGSPTTFSVVSLREPIQLGQRIDAWSLEAWADGQWKVFATGMGIGARRLWRGEPVVSDKIRLRLTDASACPALSEFAVFLEPEASRRESGERVERVVETGVDKSLWRVCSATAEGSPATHAIDGNSRTFWHTHTAAGRQAPPQAIVVDMGKELELSGFLYLPRQDRCAVGNVTRYTFETSLDTNFWREVSKGEFGNIAANPVLQKEQFAQTIKARYFRFTATAALDGCVNVAELSVLPPPLCFSATNREAGVHIADMIQPAPTSSVLTNDHYFVWGASMIQTADGVCHLFYERWPKPFDRWITDAEIAYATSKTPAGPYTFQHVILGKRGTGAEFWDGASCYNPQVLEADGKYYLYYTGNNGDIRKRNDAHGKLITQRIGVAVADYPTGPWKRLDAPLLDVSPDGLDSNFCCNPAVTRKPDGTFLMVYKCGYGEGRTGPVVHTTAEAKTPLGPFVKRNEKVFHKEGNRFPAEDPFIWFQEGKYYAVVKDMNGAFSPLGQSLVQFESSDGHTWVPSKPVLVTGRIIRWSDGTVEKVDRLERPQIWFRNGQPALLFLAVKKGDHSYNVHIPLAGTTDKKAPATRLRQE